MKPDRLISMLKSVAGFSTTGVLISSAVVGIMAAGMGSTVLFMQRRMMQAEANNIRQNTQLVMANAMSSGNTCAANITPLNIDMSTMNATTKTLDLPASMAFNYYDTNGNVVGTIIPAAAQNLENNRLLTVSSKRLTNIRELETGKTYVVDLEVNFDEPKEAGIAQMRPIIINGLRLTGTGGIINNCKTQTVFYCVTGEYRPSASPDMQNLVIQPTYSWTADQVFNTFDDGINPWGVSCNSMGTPANNPTNWNMISCSLGSTVTSVTSNACSADQTAKATGKITATCCTNY